MNGLGSYFAMGGYAAYVWPAVAVAVVILGTIWATSWRRARDADAALKRMEKADDGEA